MRVAIVGSRCVIPKNIENYVSKEDEIVSGGAKGVDAYAAAYARANGIRLKEFLPDYKRYGRAAPIVRNKEIVLYADKIVVFWNGKSKGTSSVMQYAEKMGKQCEIVLCEDEE